ncbi:MAG: aminopeptidase, partial [Chloroflexota bacterium]
LVPSIHGLPRPTGRLSEHGRDPGQLLQARRRPGHRRRRDRGRGRERCDYLNHKQYTALKYRGPGTDLTLGLPLNHIWEGGGDVTKSGIEFNPNVPTEEVFTLPHKDRVDGVVTSTRPLSYGGTLIENFTLTFEQGRVIKMTADKGETALQNLLNTDEGSARLGEVALVPNSSPISQSGLLFFNTLYDENAASHLALGQAYRFCMKDGGTLSDEEFAAAGGNQSITHVDFMMGSGEIDIDGVIVDGTTEPLMRGGEWVS